MATIKLQQGTHRTNGTDPLINSVTISSGANSELTAEVDNSVNRDQFAVAELVFTCDSASRSGIELYALYAVDGTNYEDGGLNIDPAKAPLYTFTPRASISTAQRQTSRELFLLPYKAKFLLKSEAGASATGVTLKIYTHNRTIV